MTNMCVQGEMSPLQVIPGKGTTKTPGKSGLSSSRPRLHMSVGESFILAVRETHVIWRGKGARSVQV